MTDRETAERVHGLALLADKLRLPGHRRTAEQCMEEQDEIRAGLRRLYRDLTGREMPRKERGSHVVQSLGQAGGFSLASHARDRAKPRA